MASPSPIDSLDSSIYLKSTHLSVRPFAEAAHVALRRFGHAQGELLHAFSTRLGGVSQGLYESLNLGDGCGDAAENVDANLQRFCAEGGFAREKMVSATQVHGVEILRVESETLSAQGGPYRFQNYDGFITREKHLALAVRTADCVPVLMLDPRAPAIGAFHAGWRGLQRGILQRGVEGLEKFFGAQASELVVVIGPCIGPGAFEVGAEVRELFGQTLKDGATYFQPLAKTEKWLGDLPGLAEKILSDAGVKRENIFQTGLCTHSRSDLFFSYRRDGEKSGRHLT